MEFKESIINKICLVTFSAGSWFDLKEVEAAMKNRPTSLESVFIKNEILLSEEDFKKFNNDYYDEFSFLVDIDYIDKETNKKICVRVTDGVNSVVVYTDG
ncbi:MAG: hypothetical protein ACRC5S_10595 [Cetobacterium sp.]